MIERIEREVVAPSIRGLHQDGLVYKGVLYIGLMITETGPKVLEYNVRFGDPESQVLLPLIESDFGNLSAALSEGTLDSFPLRISDKFALGVVVAAAGYPGDYPKDVPVVELPATSEHEGIVFHAATVSGPDKGVRTGGGRCFTAVGFGRGLLEARSHAYHLANATVFDGAWFRPDIGNRIFGQ
jgi:phosphoribosylamine-glycine ligase